MLKFIRGLSIKIRQSSSAVNVWNEWDPLEEIIVGVPDNASIPPLSIEAKACIHKSMWPFFEKNSGKLWSEVLGNMFWTNVINEHSHFIRVLKEEGVTVVHPEPQKFTESYTIYNHTTTGMYCTMPRDILLPIGKEIIEAPMTWRSRYFEINSYRKLLNQYWQSGASWIAAPKPTYESLFNDIFLENFNNKFVTSESEVTFDAADFVRAGADVFAQRSQVTNNMGIKWVREHLKEKGIRVTTLSFEDPRPMHIDATFLPIKPGLILSNPDRKCYQERHFIEAGWKILYAPPRIENSNHPYFLSSPWITMNVLMLNEKTVIVEDGDVELQDIFRGLQMRVIPIKFKHCNSIGGGFHCWTVDVRRKGSLQSYFDWKQPFFDECH